MNYSVLIFVALVGIALGIYFAQNNGSNLSEQSRKKQKNKEAVFDYVKTNKEIRNADVEKMLGVSDATAERYLEELETEGKIEQNGSTGRDVFYTLK